MGLLRLSVLGTSEVFHEGRRLTFALRKAEALLLYLAVEGSMHPRSKLATFLWPHSEPHDARTALRNALAFLRNLLADTDGMPTTHILSTAELIGLNPQAPLELDLDLVQQAYQQAQGLPRTQSNEQRAALITRFQQAISLVRGPFLDGFLLREETPFDEWVQLQQRQWQVRLQLLFDRLSSWYEAAREYEQASAVLTRWLALEPLSEEAYRRLMRLCLAQGDANAAWRVYAVCRDRLAQELGVEPSPQTIALVRRIEVAQTRPSTHRASNLMLRQQADELIAPLIGRDTSMNQLIGSFQQAQQGKPQVALVVGEAGIGKTRLTGEFVAWARSQGADVLQGHALEVGGRLPYQILVEAIRTRLEEENAPDDLLDDLWLAELSRILPELRVRYPDLPAPTADGLTFKVRLFEAIERLVEALAQRRPLVLLLDDLHWADEASLDLLRYLGHYWKERGTPVLLLGTARSEELSLNPQLSARLAILGRDLPLKYVTLQPLSKAETLQLLESIIREEEAGTAQIERRQEEKSFFSLETEPDEIRQRDTEPLPTLPQNPPLSRLSDFLFELTEGQPFYLLETLKLLRDRQWLLPRLGSDGTWRLVPNREMISNPPQKWSWRELLPAPVSAMIRARLAKLTPPTRQLVQACAVLGYPASARQLWHVADLEVQTGMQALDEALASGLLCKEKDGERDQAESYRCTHRLIRAVVYTEMYEARRHLLQQRALTLRSETIPITGLF
ncbi:MAG TPA: AAA family ATPase [Ktedonobacteraceae bacterium]|nr:AAA family ATPase [Ktedonobacteraceae bacterium]